MDTIIKTMGHMTSALKEIQSNMNKQTELLEKIALNTDNIHPILKDYNEKVHESSENITSCKASLDIIATDMQQLHNNRVQDFAHRRKKVMKSLWYVKKNYYLQNFNSFLQNKIKSSIYEEWLNSELYLPHKFRKHNDRMTPNERNDATKEGFKMMEDAMHTMKNNCAKFAKKMEATHDLIMNKIKQEHSNVASYLETLWAEELNLGKSKIQSSWERKEEWLRNLPNSDNISEEPPLTPKEINKQRKRRKHYSRRPYKDDPQKRIPSSEVRFPDSRNNNQPGTNRRYEYNNQHFYSNKSVSNRNYEYHNQQYNNQPYTSRRDEYHNEYEQYNSRPNNLQTQEHSSHQWNSMQHRPPLLPTSQYDRVNHINQYHGVAAQHPPDLNIQMRRSARSRIVQPNGHFLGQGW